MEQNNTAIPDKWQRVLLLPFVLGRVKQVDSSQFEYTDSFSEFASSLAIFKIKFPIPDEFKDTTEVKRFDDDFSSNPWGWCN
jgi:hypothetical protein